MKTAEQILTKHCGKRINGKADFLAAMEEYAAQRTISRESLIAIIRNHFVDPLNFAVDAADAILAELGQPPAELDMPTDDEIHEARLKHNGPDDDQISKSIGNVFEIGAKWMRSEILKRRGDGK